MNGKIGKNRKNNPDTVPDRLFPHLHLAHAQFLSPAVAGMAMPHNVQLFSGRIIPKFLHPSKVSGTKNRPEKPSQIM